MIAVIDCDSLAFSVFHPNKVLDKFGVPMRTEDGSKFLYEEKTEEQVMSSAEYFMNKILSSSGASGYIGFIKGENTTQLRLSFNSEYKADRKKTDPPKWWNFTKEYLINQWNVYEANDGEVDDYVVSAKKQVPNTFICAIDSDILGIAGKHYNWRKEEWVTVTSKQEDDKFWKEMIVGSHNGTKGLTKCGEKYAEKLFKDIDDKRTAVFKEYIKHYGEYKGIDMFMREYKCLKLIDNLDISQYKTIKYDNRVL